jgi:hypothetical protein
VLSVPLHSRLKQQFDRQRVLPPLQDAGHLQQERGARSAVVGADEPELPKYLRVVVAGNDDPVPRRLRRSGDRRDEVHHPNRSNRRRLFVPRLLGDGDAGGKELILDVLARRGDGV